MKPETAMALAAVLTGNGSEHNHTHLKKAMLEGRFSLSTGDMIICLMDEKGQIPGTHIKPKLRIVQKSGHVKLCMATITYSHNKYGAITYHGFIVGIIDDENQWHWNHCTVGPFTLEPEQPFLIGGTLYTVN